MKGRYWLMVAIILLLIAPINLGIKSGTVLRVDNLTDKEGQFTHVAMVDVKSTKGILFGALGFTRSDIKFFKVDPSTYETYYQGAILTSMQVRNLMEYTK